MGGDAEIGTGLNADLAAEVAQLLEVSPDALAADADLLAHGLDSIRMMSLAGRWRRRGFGIDFAALAAEPTLNAWSRLLGGRPLEPATDASAPQTAEGTETAPFPLAPMQHAMWVGRDDDVPLGGVAGHLYVEFDSLPGRDAVDPHRLATATTALTARHPMLRVEFYPDGTQRIRGVDEYRSAPLTVIDLRDAPDDVVITHLAEVRQAKTHQQQDDSVLELMLTRLPDGRSRLHVDLDMQAADAMSYRRLMADLAAAYTGVGLPALGYTYRQYRTALAETTRADKTAHRSWWAQRIPYLPDAPALPNPPGRPADPKRSIRRWHLLDIATRDALYAHARVRGITPAMALAGSFAHTLARWAGQPHMLLNLPLFCREPVHPDVDALVGDFTSSLLLDVDLTGAVTATDRARATQEAMREAASHADYSGLDVLRDLGRHRGTPVLAPVVFTSALGLGELFAPAVGEAFGEASWIISQGPQVALDAQVTEVAGGVLINWDVREEMFASGVIDAMFDYHTAELHRLAAASGAWEDTAPPALPEAQRRTRDRINDTSAPLPSEGLHEGFFRQADRRPGAPASCGDFGVLSYGQLRTWALGVGAILRRNGIRPGDTVAVAGPKNVAQLPALLGILAAGGVYLPIGADQPPNRAERMLTIADARAILCTGPVDLDRQTIPVLDVGAVTEQTGGFTPATTDPESLAYVLFTSGSTGEPKGVEVTHHAVGNTVGFLADRYGFGPHDRSLALLPPEADMSVLDVFAVLEAGGTVVMVDESQRRDPHAWARLVAEHRVSVLNLMPGSLQMLLSAATPGALSSLRTVLTGGDVVPVDLAARLRAHAPQLRFAGLGGATETAIHATFCDVDTPDQDWACVPYGVPFPNIACRVVDITDPRHPDAPDWAPGELWISGRGIARGYRARPELTAQRFLEYDGRIWYRTGDLARYRPNGALEFVGRSGNRVKISGYRVELGEVEAALRRVEAVRDAVAVLLPGERLAALVSVGSVAPIPAEIRAALTHLVPEHMIPKLLEVVGDLAYTPAGKIDRRAAAAHLQRLARSTPDGSPPQHTALQTALAAIIGDVLGRSGDTIAIDADFFALGGDSVLATTVVARIRTWLDTTDVIVPDVFAARTVAALAGRMLTREVRPGRLEETAEVYLAVAALDAEQLEAAMSKTQTHTD